MEPAKRSQGKPKTLFRARGLVHDLIVTRQGATTTLWSEAGTKHTVFDRNSPHLPGLEYARNMLAALAFCPQAGSCLVLGLGGGSIPRMLLAALPQIEVDAVEIDPTVVDLAARYFDIRALPRLRIHIEDAADFVRRRTSRYGIVVVDTYVGEKLPDQCMTLEFIQNAKECLAEDGVLAVNWLGGDLRTQDALLKNLQLIAGPVWQLPGMRSRNLIYFAPSKPITRSDILSAAAAIETKIPFDSSFARFAQQLSHA